MAMRGYAMCVSLTMTARMSKTNVVILRLPHGYFEGGGWKTMQVLVIEVYDDTDLCDER